MHSFLDQNLAFFLIILEQTLGLSIHHKPEEKKRKKNLLYLLHRCSLPFGVSRPNLLQFHNLKFRRLTIPICINLLVHSQILKLFDYETFRRVLQTNAKFLYIMISWHANWQLGCQSVSQSVSKPDCLACRDLLPVLYILSVSVCVQEYKGSSSLSLAQQPYACLAAAAAARPAISQFYSLKIRQSTVLN